LESRLNELKDQLSKVLADSDRLDEEAQELLRDPDTYRPSFVSGLEKWWETIVLFHGNTNTIEASVYSGHVLLGLISMPAGEVTDLHLKLARELDRQEGDGGGGRWGEVVGNKQLREAVTAIIRHATVHVALPEVPLRQYEEEVPVPDLDSFLPSLEVSWLAASFRCVLGYKGSRSFLSREWREGAAVETEGKRDCKGLFSCVIGPMHNAQLTTTGMSIVHRS
jgi:hypothetical protein